MVGMSMGLAARGKIPFSSTFACFFTRAFDFIRMAAISQLNVKFAGTHVGVSIGEDGPSQMGLEDIAMFAAEPNYTVLYPSDAASAWAATMLAAELVGPTYIRLGRPNNPIVYSPDEKFEIGKSKVLRQGNNDRILVVAAGITLFEALKAYDELKKSGIDIRVRRFIQRAADRSCDAPCVSACCRQPGHHRRRPLLARRTGRCCPVSTEFRENPCLQNCRY